MDPLTHALSGALASRASYRLHGSQPGLSLGERTLAGAVAALFPDVDSALYLYDTLTYLNWHRGITHSLILMPFWAWLVAVGLAWSFKRIRGRPYRWRDLYGVCLLGIAIHIGGDCITPYGTMLFAPFLDTRYSLSTTFVVDPWVTATLVIGLLGSLRWPARGGQAGLLALGLYLGGQLLFHDQARELGREYALRYGLKGDEVHALPQPLSPFNWKIMVVDGEWYHSALVDLNGGQRGGRGSAKSGFLQRLLSAYRPGSELTWTQQNRFGVDPRNRPLAREAWHQASMAAVRRFALFPAVFRRTGNPNGKTCIWFTDLRFVVPGLAPPFQFRICKMAKTSAWGEVRFYWSLNIRKA